MTTVRMRGTRAGRRTLRVTARGAGGGDRVCARETCATVAERTRGAAANRAKRGETGRNG